MKILVVGGSHSMCDKRVMATVYAFAESNKISKVFYQYSESNLNVPYVRHENCGNMLEKLRVKLISYKFFSSRIKVPGFYQYFRWKQFGEFILEVVASEKIDLVYLHEIPPHYPLIKRLKLLGKKVVFDAHEIYPDLTADTTLVGRVLRNALWKMYKKQIVIPVDKMIFVSPKIAEYVLSKLKTQKEFLVVYNYAVINNKPLPLDAREKKVIAFGGTQVARYPSDKTLKMLETIGYDILILGSIDHSLYKSIKNIYFIPKISYNEMIRIISKAEFVLIDTMAKKPSESFHVFSAPNRFFNAISAGTPILVKDWYITITEMVKQDNLGYIFRGESDLREFLFSLTNNKYNEMLKSIERNQYKYYWSDYIKERFVSFVLK